MAAHPAVFCKSMCRLGRIVAKNSGAARFDSEQVKRTDILPYQFFIL